VSSNGSSNGASRSRSVRRSELFEKRLVEVAVEYPMASSIVHGVSLFLSVQAEEMPGSRRIAGPTWVHQTDAEHHPALWIYYTLDPAFCTLQWLEAADEEIPTKLR
jgi:hypothetical protein